MDLFRWSFDPWAGLRQLRSEMDDVFRRFSGAVGSRQQTPSVNVHQDDEGVAIVAETPGVKSEDLAIEVEGDRLRLKVSRSQPEGVKDEQYHRRERLTGEFTREVKLPAGLDAEKVEASLTDGVLTVHLPKAEAAKPRKISVKAG